MTQVYFTSDWHMGHHNIQRFRHWVTCEEDNTAKLEEEYTRVITKRDTVFFLGDIVFDYVSCLILQSLPGRKILVAGNHEYDDNMMKLEHVFDNVYGFHRYKGYWLSHCPIHPAELRGRINIHGHVHDATLPDKRFLNVCVDNIRILNKEGWCESPYLISLDEVRRYHASTSGH